MISRITISTLTAAILFPIIAAAQAPVPIDDDFLIQSDPSAWSNSALVATSAGGAFFVVWYSEGEIYGRRFSALGTPLGAQFQINTLTNGSQAVTGIGMNAGGAAVVAMHNPSPWPGESRIRRYDAFGNPLGPEEPIGTPGDATTYAVVDMADSGAFVVAYRQGVYVDQSTEILVKRYDGNGGALGPGEVINTFISGTQSAPAVAVAPGGSFVVVWQSEGSNGSDGSGTSIQGRRFSATGNPLGDQFQVNTTISGDQSWPDVGIADSGAFVVVWDSDSSAGSDNFNGSVQAQMYQANGLPLGGEFQVNTYIYDWQGESSVAVAPNGSFTVVWDSDGSPESDTDATSTQARSFTATGMPLSDQYQVNTTEVGYQRLSHVAGDPSSRHVIVWDHYTDGVEWTVRGRLYGYPTIFFSTFENGDLSDWSFSVQ